MKKLLILFSVLFAVSISSYANIGDVVSNVTDTVYHDSKAVVDTLYHDGKTALGQVYEDAKLGAVSIYPDVKQAVVAIGKAIGIAAEHVYSVLVKKYFVLGIKHLCICLIGLIALVCGLIWWKKVTPEGKPITYRVIMPCLFILIGIITMAKVNYDDMLMGIINPEYGAINYILEYSKELINGK